MYELHPAREDGAGSYHMSAEGMGYNKSAASAFD